MNFEPLYQLGLNTSEVRVYVTLLELGSSSTGPIMDKAKVSSSKIYGILSRLSEKGLISTLVKGRTKYFQASNPATLLTYAKEQEKDLHEHTQKIKQMIPELHLKTATKDRQETQMFVGWRGIMTAFNMALDHLHEGDDYIAFAQTPSEEASEEVKIFFNKYQRAREQKKLNVKLIAHESQRRIFSRPPYSKFKKFAVRFVTHYPSGIVIFGDNVFISTFEQSPVGVIITSKQLAQSYRMYFQATWKEASS